MGQEDLPTKSLPVKSPLALLENPLACAGDELVFGGADFGESIVHCFRDLVRRMARQIFLQCISE